jgi:hypothetical protein
MIANILAGVASGGLAGALVIWLAKSVITERIKNAIKHEYDIRLENHKSSLKSELEKQIEVFKSQVRAQESVVNTKWEIKRDACLKALDIVDAFWANIEWTGKDAKGKEIDASAIEKQDAPAIEYIRSCYNSLALSCDGDSVLREYKRCLQITGDFKGDAIVDLRNAIRKELGFGADIDFDRATAFIGRVNKPAS